MQLDRRIAVAIALSLTVIAIPASAQRGIGGGGMGGMGGMGRGGRRNGGGEMGRNAEANIEFPTAKDLEKFNPAALVIDKRKKLSLADSQVTALTAIRSKIYERNASILAQYDSLRRDFKPPRSQDRDRTGSTPETDSARVASLRQMQTLRSLLDSVTARRTTDVGEVLNYISDPNQHRTAVDLLNDQDRDFTDKMPKLPGAGGGMRGRRSGGQP